MSPFTFSLITLISLLPGDPELIILSLRS